MSRDHLIECKLGAAKNVKNRSGVLHSNASEQEKKAAEQCFQEVTGRVKTKRLEPHADASKDLSSLWRAFQTQKHNICPVKIVSPV